MNLKSSLSALVPACLLLVSACSVSHRETVQSQLGRPDTALRKESGQTVSGFTDAMGRYHKFDGRIRLIPGDSLEFIGPALKPSPWTVPTRPDTRLVIPRDSVSTIYMTKTDPLRTTFAVIGGAAAALAIAVAIAVATKESCPFLYSNDGHGFVFDGEPYGGAIMRSLARTDWSELEHIRSVHGQYRLLLTNEVDETQYTNSLRLLVVDHSPLSTVIMDKEGRPHAFRRLLPLESARDEAGRDLLVWLRETDLAAWQPNLGAFSKQDSLGDVRNHIVLEFERPRDLKKAYLVTNVATHQWGSHTIRSILSMHGNQVGDYYAAINGSEGKRRELLQWNDREELYHLFVEVLTGHEWVRQDFIPGGGPFISESRAIPLDLSGVSESAVQIRINPPIGFWSLNSFHLAWEEDSTRVTTLNAISASGPRGQQTIDALRSDDNDYLVFPDKETDAELAYQSPPTTPGMTRTIFAETRGWYEVHLHGLGNPDPNGLRRMASEPGFLVRRAMLEYAEYQRTGVLLGTGN
jgi:hypothetical protein